MKELELTQEQIEEVVNCIAVELGKGAMLHAFAVMQDIGMPYPGLTEQQFADLREMVAKQ